MNNITENQVYDNLKKLSQQTEEVLQAEHVDGDKVTKLLFQQMFEGLNLQQFGQQR